MDKQHIRLHYVPSDPDLRRSPAINWDLWISVALMAAALAAGILKMRGVI